jgi:hypothetical protein
MRFKAEAQPPAPAKKISASYRFVHWQIIHLTTLSVVSFARIQEGSQLGSELINVANVTLPDDPNSPPEFPKAINLGGISLNIPPQLFSPKLDS